MNTVIYVGHCSFMHFISNQKDFSWIRITPFQILANPIRSLICRGIVYYNQPIVQIFLLENRLQMPNISMIYNVIISWSDYTSRYFVYRFICSVSFSIILFFVLVYFLQLRIFLKVLACKSLVLQTLQEPFASYIFLMI